MNHGTAQKISAGDKARMICLISCTYYETKVILSGKQHNRLIHHPIIQNLCLLNNRFSVGLFGNLVG